MDSYSSAMVSNSISAVSTSKAAHTSQAMLNSKVNDVDDAAKEFEAVFISQMLRPMFETIPNNELMGGGRAEEMWRDMMIEEYGKIVAEKGGLGIADSVRSELIKAQEVSQQ